MPIRKKLFLIAALLYILYTVFPLFADIVNIPVWLPSMAALLLFIILYPQAYVNRTVYWTLAYALVLVIYLFVGHPLTIGIGSVEDSKKILIEFAYLFPSVSIFCILYYLKDDVLTKKLIIWSVVFLYLSFVIAIPLMQSYGSIRSALKESRDSISVPGLPSYSLMHAYTLFVPVVCYCVKAFSGRLKVISLLGLAILSFVVYDTFVTTSLLLLLLILLFSLLYSDKNRMSSWAITVGGSIIILLLYEAGFFIALIDFIMPAFEGTAVQPKLYDFKDSMLQGHLTGSNIINRQDYHGISWDSFLGNPIFGVPIVGGHSSMMDRFGGMGFFAGFPYLMIFISFVKQMASSFHKRMAKSFFWVGVIVGFVFLYNKSSWDSENWLFFIVLLPMGLKVAERIVFNKTNRANHP